MKFLLALRANLSRFHRLARKSKDQKAEKDIPIKKDHHPNRMLSSGSRRMRDWTSPLEKWCLMHELAVETCFHSHSHSHWIFILIILHTLHPHPQSHRSNNSIQPHHQQNHAPIGATTQQPRN